MVEQQSKTTIGQEVPKPRIAFYFITLAVLWTFLVGGSLCWNLYRSRASAMGGALIQARVAFEKDVIYRRWNALAGGLYAPITEETPPNPYLDIPDRDLQTPSGQKLTKVNPAYMTRQVHSLGALSTGILGHITSLKPLRPENAADPWETEALLAFEKGADERHGVEKLGDRSYLRYMQPLLVEESCMLCHKGQGYRLGDIRGGISVSVPLDLITSVIHKDRDILLFTHSVLWVSVLLILFLFNRQLSRRVEESARAAASTNAAMLKAREAQMEAKLLRGLLPICSSCKKIRDDRGDWQSLECYIGDRSEAEFTHGICPDCARELYPELPYPPTKLKDD